LYSQLLAFETSRALLYTDEGGSSVNVVGHGRGRSGCSSFGHSGNQDHSSGGFGRGGFGRGGNGRGNFSRGGYINSSSTDKSPICQVCKKRGHIADRCWHHFEEDFVPEERTAATTATMGDNSWYTDSCPADHITSDLENLSVCDKYTGNDQIHIASGSGMNIRHIGHNTIHSPCCQLQLNSILHVSQASKNLISVHHLASDNNVFLEFYPHFFSIKDLDSRNILLKGPC
jgi:hypothetical protein